MLRLYSQQDTDNENNSFGSMHIDSGTARMGIGLRRQMGLVLPMRGQVFRLLWSQETDSYEMVKVFTSY